MDRRQFLKYVLSLPFILALSGIRSEVTPKTKPQEVLLLDTVVTGFFYYQGEGVWKNLEEGQPLRLVREPANPHDEKAIEVYWKNEKLGYIPRIDNLIPAQLMDSGKRLIARISWLDEHDDPWERVGLEVSLQL